MPNDEANISNLIEKKFKNNKLELKIISYCLQKNHDSIFLIDKDALCIEVHRIVWEILRKEKFEMPVDILMQNIKKSVKEDDYEIYKIQIKKIYETDLENVTKKNIEKLVSKLNELYKSRKLMNEISDIVTNIETFNLDSRIFNLKNIILNTSVKSKDIIDYVEDYHKRRDHLKEVASDPHRLSGIPTGIKEFDELSGGIMRGEFCIVAMGTGQGKSLTLGNFGINAFSKNYNVFVATLEMSNRQYAYRADSRIARIEYQKFRTAELNIFDYENWEKKIDKIKRVKDNFFKIGYFQRGSSVNDIISECYKLQEQEEKYIDFLIIDYLQLLSLDVSRGSNKNWDSQSDIAWQIKEVAQSFNDNRGIAIVTANQLTDEGINAKKINVTHLKYSRGTAEVAPLILSISQNKEDELQDILKLWVIKCRDIEKPKLPILLYPNFKYMILDDKEKRKEMEEKDRSLEDDDE